MPIQSYKRKAIKDGTVLKQVSFTDNDNLSALDGNYFADGNTYRRDLKILKRHSQRGSTGKFSTGSTCLVYDGRLGDLDVIVKEFYPDTEKGFFYIERSDGEDQKLRFHEITENGNREFSERRRQFLTGYQNQKEYVKMDDLCEIITLPLGLGRYGQSYYIVSPVNQGVTLDSIKKWDGIQQKMRVLLYIADMLRILEKRNILYLDLAPDNLLYVEVSDMVQQIKLFDVDGFIDLNNKADVHEISFHPDYVWPELVSHLAKGRSFDRQKEHYLIPYAAVYSFGIIAFEILFGHLPDGEERKFSVKGVEALKEDLFEQQMAPELQDNLIKLLKSIFTNDLIKAENVYQELGGIYKKLQMPKYRFHKKYDESNYLYFCYDMMQKYPLFRFAGRLKNPETKESGYRMDIALVGNHEIRKYFLKAVLPCGQMLNSSLTIRLISDDAADFWKEFSEKINPELWRAVNCYGGGEISYHDPQLVDGELANIYLYNTSDHTETIRILKETKSQYILLIRRQNSENRDLIEHMETIRFGRKPVFIGFTGRKKYVPAGNENCTILPITSQQVLSGYYSGSEWKSKVYRMGLQIHYNYELTKNPRASLKEIEKNTYAGNYYNRASSERAALHILYKLASIGITDLESGDLLFELQRKLFSRTAAAKNNFEQLIWLEHKSWTANQICDGWRQLPMKEFKDFAYEGAGNTWKDNKNKRHPYMVSSKPKRALAEISLKEVLDQPEGRDLDELDLVSLKVYEGLLEKAADRKRMIDANLQDIDHSVEREEKAQFEWDFRWLKNSIEDCYGKSLRTNAGLNWEQAVKAFSDTAAGMSLKRPGVRNRIMSRVDEIKNDMAPILEAVKRTDIKVSDEDVVKAIPQILVQTGGTGRLVIIRPVTEKVRENVFSTLLIRPQTLVFIERDAGTIDTEYYKRLLCKFGLSEISIKKYSVSAFRVNGIRGQLFWDFTGLTPFEVYFWMRNPAAKQSVCFDIYDLKLRAWNDKTIEMLPYDIHLTVRETLELTGGLDMTEFYKNTAAQLTEEQYKIIWNTCRKINGLQWRALIRTVNSALNKMNVTVPLNMGEERDYTTEFIYNRILEETGLKAVLKKCEGLGLIRKLQLPSVSEQGNRIRFSTEYEALANALIKMSGDVIEENTNPIRFRYVIKSWNEEKIQINNNSLYCSLEVLHSPIDDLAEKEYLDDMMEKCLLNLNPDGKEDVVFQNMKIANLKEKKGKRISFVFASDAVREVLKNEGGCLEFMVYYECLKNRVFDDIRIKSRVYWGDSRINNEIDVIGIKNNKSYFIFVKTGVPETAFLQEISQITKRFSIAGQPILISSNYSMKNDSEDMNLVQRSNMLGIRYIGMNRILKEDGTVIIADAIREIVG